ncbi:MAG TPA: polyprenyl synthetase family protein [Verrucomicrobiae bacterium]|nr:polyprenyl synthetase family protein [Verrucomicrobiae bacterium]
MSQTITLEEIYLPVEKQLAAVPDTILDILSTRNDLTEAVVRYFFSAKGKLLRPALTLLGAAVKSSASGPEKSATRLGSAFEIFHSATLIHDDIIDAAHLRRNLETVHLKWSPQVAVLVGDYLHDQAIKAVFETHNQSIVALFLKTAGEVCDGEIHELKERNNFRLTEDEYLEIIDKKTASLLACSAAGGGLLAGASEKESQALQNFGRYFGISFQIVDDCLDLTGNEDEFGKTLGADLAAGVLTLPLIYLLSVSGGKKREAAEQIFRSPMTPESLQALTGMLREEGAIQYAMKRAREFSDKARQELAVFEEGPARRSLDRLLDYVLERNR